MRRGAYTWIAGGLALLVYASPASCQELEPPLLPLPAPPLEPVVEERTPLDDGWVAAEKRESSPDSSTEAFLPPVSGVVTARSVTPLTLPTRGGSMVAPRTRQVSRTDATRPPVALSSPITMRSSRLRVESQTSYERSLLPLADHLENLALAEVAALSQVPVNADARPWPEVDSAALLRALEPRLRELRRTVEVLERFRQPAAVGYDADLALARYALAEASLNAAWLTGEMSAVPRLTAETQRQARQRYHQLVFDYHVLGTASLPELADAIAMQNLSPQLDTQLRGAVAQQTEHWKNAGAGIGRQDRLSRARLQQVESRAQLARLQEQPEELAQQLIRADEIAQQLLSNQRARWNRGTITLADLSRSWQLRWQVHREAERNGWEFGAQSTESLDRDLKHLVQLTYQQTDRRGRIGADVLRIELLADLRGMNSLRQ